MEDRAYNFAAGPAQMPESVLKKAQSELLNWHGCGMSVMEMSHRGSQFKEIYLEARERLKHLLGVPETHEVLFLQGGATTQFAAIPLNLMGKLGASYAVTGNFSGIAAREAEKYGPVSIAWDGTEEGFTRIPRQEELNIEPNSAYFHYCANNTIFGTAWDYVPETGGVPVVCDMSSEIMSRPVDVARYALIYAGAQKNMAPAGVTVVIVDRFFAGHERPETPQIMSYQKEINKESMLNTPPCWCIYMLGLVLDWLEAQGGVPGMEAIKHKKAQMLYDVLDRSKLFTCAAEAGSRSDMNVTFRSVSEELNDKFVQEAAAAGFTNLKGHRSVGGMRASIYNAMPTEGIEKLCDFIQDFDKKN